MITSNAASVNSVEEVASEIIQRTAIGIDIVNLVTIIGILIVVVVGLIVVLKGRDIISGVLYKYIEHKMEAAIKCAVDAAKLELRTEQENQFKELKTEITKTGEKVNQMNASVEKMAGTLEGYLRAMEGKEKR